MMENVFRKQYRQLSEDEQRHVDAVKTSAELLYRTLHGGDPRAMALAKTKLEECVMWAVKGLT